MIRREIREGPAKRKQTKRSYDEKTYQALVWSLGCVLLCMVTTTADPSKDFPLKISALYNKDLITSIKGMLNFDRDKRPTLEQILADPFLQSHKTKLELELSQAKSTKVRENLIGKAMEMFKIEFEEKGKLG